MIAVILTFLVAIAICLVVRATADKDREIDEEVWKRARSQFGDSGAQAMLDRLLLNVARPVARIPAIYNAADSKQYRFLQAKLMASGGVYGGSVEVYLAVQAVGLLGALLAGVALFTSNLSGLFLGAGAGLALMFAYLPFHKITSASDKRRKAIVHGLPDFAELLQMSIAGGMSVLQAMEFTAERLEGPVADEVRNLVKVVRSRSTKENEAFQLAAARLGTPDAEAFFAALGQAHLEGARVSEQLARQADALRTSAYQASRAEFKKLPTKLVMVMGLFMIPCLIGLILIPAVIIGSAL